MVDRYYGPLAGFEMRLGERGDYVRYSDYASLEVDFELLRKDRDDWQKSATEFAARIAALEAQLAEVREYAGQAAAMYEAGYNVSPITLATSILAALEATPPAPKVTDAMVERALISWFEVEVTWDRGMTPPTRARMVESMRSALTAALEVGNP